MKFLNLFLVLLSLSQVFAKENLSLEECIQKAKQNYPLYNNTSLLDEALSLNLSKLNKNFIPHVKLGAKATYQNEVTRLPLENLPINFDYKPLNKDQYNLYAEISQPLLDFATLAQKAYKRAEFQSEQASLQNELYKVQQSVINAYFYLLLINLQLEQNDIHLKELEKNHTYIENLLRNGVALREDLERIEIEILDSNASKQELLNQRFSTAYTLFKLTNLSLDEYELQMSSVKEMSLYLSKIGKLENKLLTKRPEIAYFDAKRQEIEASKKLENAKNLPYLDLFLQAGYGNPTLNMLKNEFDTYYIVGVRVN
ncbi:TolC family protein [Campylobacter sp. MIT 99-7217]|uniref:TolC family protein n=1 Tax=Campylobacter sp. MIT 99-7217 TaxID=535091 RepID=UPI00163CE363|nr:TolC family protein [Campylobacter sp. MIT 99-7217]